MGFVGGGGNIAIVIALPLFIFVLIAFKYSLVCVMYSSYYLRLPGTSVSAYGDYPGPPPSCFWGLQNTLQ